MEWQNSATATTTTLPTNTPSPVVSLKGHTCPIVAIAFSPDRSLLATAGKEGAGRVWEVGSSLRERATFGASGAIFNSLGFAPNGRTLLAGSGTGDGRIRLLDVSEKNPRDIGTLKGGRGVVDVVSASPDGKLVASGGEDRTLRLWEPGGAFRDEPRNQLTGHTGAIRALAFAPDSQGLATVGRDSTVRVWTLSRIRSWQRAILPHPSDASCVSWSPDGRIIATVCQAGIVRLWEPNAVKPSPWTEFGGRSGGVHLMAFTSSTGNLVTVSESLKVTNWDAHSGRPLREWDLPIERMSSVALTADGRYLAVGQANGVVDIYRVAEKRY